MISQDDFRAWLLEQGKSTLTARSYLSAIRSFSAWLSAERGIDMLSSRVNQRTVKDYLLWMALEEKKPSTINQHLAAIRLYYDLARQLSLMDASPAEGVPIRAPDPLSAIVRPTLTLDDTRSLLQTARALNGDSTLAIRNTAILATMISTGLQVRAICSLNVEHFERDRIELTNGEAKRSLIPLSRDAIRALEDWLQARSELEPHPASAGQALFISKGGERLTPRSVQKILAQLGRQADLDLERNLSARIIRRSYMAHQHPITPLPPGRTP
jgi:integrase/recombinase XerC